MCFVVFWVGSGMVSAWGLIFFYKMKNLFRGLASLNIRGLR